MLPITRTRRHQHFVIAVIAGCRLTPAGAATCSSDKARSSSRLVKRAGGDVDAPLALQVDAGKLDRGQVEELLAAFNRRLTTYTYLS